MTVLDKLKSLLGIESRSTQRRRGNVGVTVEEAPDEGDSAGGGQNGPASPAEPTTPDAEAGDTATPAGTAEATDGDADAGGGSTTDDGSGDGASTGEEADLGTDESPDVIKGIGPSYADTLSAAGVDTVADLAVADPDDLESETGLSAKRLERWIGRARNR